MRFTDSHEWISLQGNEGTVGITHHAQKELGEIVYIQLPKVGDIVKRGAEVCVLESTKAAADVYAPVSGKVTAINEELRSNPALINQDPEERAWLFKMELSNAPEYDKLLSMSAYKAIIQ